LANHALALVAHDGERHSRAAPEVFEVRGGKDPPFSFMDDTAKDCLVNGMCMLAHGCFETKNYSHLFQMQE
jgi:hypothetical protein